MSNTPHDKTAPADFGADATLKAEGAAALVDMLAESALGEPKLTTKPESRREFRTPASGTTMALPHPPKRRVQNQLCQILLQNGDVTAANVRKALKVQEEHGGQIGRILVAMGACSERAVSRALLEQVRRRGLHETSLSQAARESPALAGLAVTCSPARTVFVLFASDFVALLTALLAGFAVQFLREWTPHREAFYLLVSAVTLCAAAYPSAGLYSAMSNSTPDELRSGTVATSVSLLGVCAVAIFGEKATRLWTFLSLFVWWALAVVLVPTGRAFMRYKYANRNWFGHPVIVLGAAKTGRLIIRTLKSQPGRGLKPVMLLDDDSAKHGTLRASALGTSVELQSVRMAASDLIRGSMLRSAADFLGAGEPPPSSRMSIPPVPPSNQDLSRAVALPPDRPSLGSVNAAASAPSMFAEVDGIPIVGELALAPILAHRLKIKYAVLAMPGLEAKKLLRITERVGHAFTHMLVIPDLFGLGSIGVPAKDLGGVLGIEVRQQLLLPGPRLMKRIMDVVLTSIGGIFVLPILAILTLLIVIDSRGSPFYKQKRLGRDGGSFMAHKFRSMHGDGEARLAQVLDSNPSLRAEYAKFHKLRNDPRVTRIGKVLRKYSLDELPQLWNVLRGDMSLVGPRPYLERELKDMDAQEGFILRAPPGVTGLWQVSDRNAIGFSGRVKMDVHYVRNWSPWLDIYILARTFGVVARGTGM
jgi:lipopolysaccharide/colanic/teichoic acid biosynthesis glycosyltransferase